MEVIAGLTLGDGPPDCGAVQDIPVAPTPAVSINKVEEEPLLALPC
jgi:hypothetical protein